ncbi:hypothetical protein EDC94DRAFT_624936 [Helicostylum pulchrum]|nr:hypothetical protein EDC94DRAFT_624936 [Helicostylum pulchrum]
MNPLPPSTIYSPPPYTKPNQHLQVTQLSSPHTQPKRRRPRRKCHICGFRAASPHTREIGPYLIHRTRPDLVYICPCLNRAHPICLLSYGTDYICNVCNYIYQSRWYIYLFSHLLCFMCHLLSLGSAVGLVFGLSHLGRVLDEIGLGSEMGPKLDGDETWQDHEMTQIVQWLNIVHFTTGLAGEALLGLVYIVGVVLVIGLDRTLVMVSNILYIQLNYKQSPKWFSKGCIYICLFVLGLVLGTYLLFFSWIWASVLQHVRKKILNVKIKNQRQKCCGKLCPPPITTTTPTPTPNPVNSV